MCGLACDNWSAFAGCFFLALWGSAQTVWGLHGAMGELCVPFKYCGAE